MASNNDRADWAQDAIELFAKTTGLKIEDDGAVTVVSDLLCDIRHYCRRENLSWKDVLRRAAMHYNAEKFGFED